MVSTKNATLYITLHIKGIIGNYRYRRGKKIMQCMLTYGGLPRVTLCCMGILRQRCHFLCPKSMISYIASLKPQSLLFVSGETKCNINHGLLRHSAPLTRGSASSLLPNVRGCNIRTSPWTGEAFPHRVNCQSWPEHGTGKAGEDRVPRLRPAPRF